VTRAASILLLGAALLAGCGENEPARPDERRPINGRLLAAAYENDVARARRLIEDGADVNAKDESGQSAYQESYSATDSAFTGGPLSPSSLAIAGTSGSERNFS
jgi:hypothetical protein